MARQHRNDSSQMKDLMQFREPESSAKEKREEGKHHSGTDGVTQASCSFSSSSPPTSSASSSFPSSSFPPAAPASSSFPSSSATSSSFPSSSFPSSLSPHTSEDEARRKVEGREAVPAWREEEEKRESSSGSRLDDLRQIQHCGKVMGKLEYSRRHTVLIDVLCFNNKLGVFPHEGKDLWQSSHVKMPCSKIVNSNGYSQESKWKWISNCLQTLSKKKEVSIRDVEATIMDYNTKYKGQWSFDALSSFVQRIPKSDNYVPKLIPKIAALALRLPEEIKTSIPLLQRGHTAAITLSQLQIAVLLANAFFCTFPHRNTTSPKAEYHNYPSINFSSLFGMKSERKNQKLRAIMHYFNEVTKENAKLDGLVTFERRCLKGTNIPDWRSCTEKINKLYVSSHGNIEDDGIGLLQVDFAASMIGGGVLGSGLVQEEILFLINPELIVSRLFTERLTDNECLIIAGSQKFSCHSGYSDDFQWLGPHTDQLPRDEWGRLQRQILAIDALHYKIRSEQYNMGKITRELNKAYCGFKGRVNHMEPDIATGKWGCGAFNGDAQLKAVIQLMAAAKAGRGLAFFTFKDELLKRGLRETHHLLVTEEITVGKLYSLLDKYCTKLQKRADAPVELFDFIRKNVGRERSYL